MGVGSTRQATPLALMLASGGARVLSSVVSASATLMIAHLLVAERGATTYATYGLITSMAALLPFADLGLGAAVTNTLIRHDDRSSEALQVLTTVWRLLFASVLVICGAAVALASFRLLGPALGVEDPGIEVAALICLLLFSLTVPLGVGSRVLLARNRNHVAILTQAAQGPIALLTIIALLAFGVKSVMLPSAYFAGLLMTTTLTFLVALMSTFPMIPVSLSAAIRKQAKGVKFGQVVKYAGPMLTIMICLPLALQSDRVLLSHVSSPGVLAQYNLAGQFFLPIWGVVSAAGLTLWPALRTNRAGRAPVTIPQLARLSSALFAVGGSAAVLIALLSPLLARIVADQQIHLAKPLVWGFASLVAVQALQYPLGMFLTDGSGLRLQAMFLVAMVPANILLSWSLISPLGAAGPIIASSVCVFVFQLLPCSIFSARRIRCRSFAVSTME